MNRPELSVVIPVFNNPEGPEKLLKRLIPVLEDISGEWHILFVDDGSEDLKEDAVSGKLKNLSGKDGRIGWISLKENRGQQTAVFAGISTASEILNRNRNRLIITMDDDLAHPPEVIYSLVKEVQRGPDIVFAVPRPYKKKDRFSLNRIGGISRDLFFRIVTGTPRRLKVGSFRIMKWDTAWKAVRKGWWITGFTENNRMTVNNSFVYISALVFKHTKKASNVEYERIETDLPLKKTTRYSFIKRMTLLLKLFLFYSPVCGHLSTLIGKKRKIPLYEIKDSGGWAGNMKNNIKLHILGGSYGQLNAIERARKMEIHTVVSDINPEAPGIKIADEKSGASTFDFRKVADDARKFGSSAFLATGTDQPVLTAALASELLNIPYFLNSQTARLVTNKREMKRAFRDLGIPTSPFQIISRDTDIRELSGLNPPLVIKPLDSQGQRGVMRLESPEEIPGVIDKVLSFSRENEVLIEEYYPSGEVTISGWVEDGKYIHLTTTDRITRDNLPSIGVCPAHHYPSRFSEKEAELIGLTEDIVTGFGIPRGPVYFQYLIGDKGIRINEAACRLGGAYEDEFIPWITGVDIMEIMIKMSCGMDFSFPTGIMREKNCYVSLQMFFYNQGVLKGQKGMEEISKLPGILGGRFLLSPGTIIGSRENSTQRAGYFIASGKTAGAVNLLAIKAFNCLKAWNENGNSLIASRPELLP